MGKPIEKIKYKGYKIKVFIDEDAENPGVDESDCFVIYDHSQFCTGTARFKPFEVFETMQLEKPLHEKHYYFPLYAYIHGGVSLSLSRNSYPFNDRWDTSFKGFIMVKQIKGWSWRREQSYKIAEYKLKEWNEYLQGEVYGYSSKAGSCWGFYGDTGKELMIQEAKDEIDYYIENFKK